jgi:superfamily II DNA or RNA helicase
LAAFLTLRPPPGTLDGLSRSIASARVDLNPHQIDAALFAVRSPLSKGVILADEVGLGKTIEAGLVLAQRWAERRRRILLVLPATLRTQWARELEEKFFLPSLVMEARSYGRLRKEGVPNPFSADRIVLCSYHFAANHADEVAAVPWDLVVVDEAHRLRNVYKAGNKVARALRDAVGAAPKLLLTATPLQNSLMELYGLVGFIDEHVFGDEGSFREQFARGTDEEARNAQLRQRLAPILQRTLRRQVLEYIRFTHRVPLTWEFVPTDDEHQLYEEVSVYLQRKELLALPSGQRMLMTMVLRKLLASSTFAIAGTLRTLVDRLQKLPGGEDAIAEDFDTFDELREEWGDEDEGAPPTGDAQALREELAELRRYLDHATRIEHNAKGHALLSALTAALAKAVALGAARKAVVFTESRRTQDYLFRLLEAAGYAGRVLLLNGSNNDERSKQIHAAWAERHKGSEVVTGSRAVDVKSAIVEAFREDATILVATEAAAEGVNLQFCSLVVNYDLPWNPQRIEQRIGRCHRYGQQHDVVVVNFLNKRNAADQRVYELLAEKFRLFDGVFGASDGVLGALESGVDIERRIAEVYQNCRTPAEITAAFDALQADLDEEIADRLAQTRRAVLDHFDQEVQARLGVHQKKALEVLDQREQRLWSFVQAELAEEATFDDEAPRFVYRGREAAAGAYHLDWRAAEANGDTFFRLEHPLAQAAVTRALGRALPVAEVRFDYAAHGAPVAVLAERRGMSGWLSVARARVASLQDEEHLLAAAVTDGGDELDAAWCDKLLGLPAGAGAVVVSATPGAVSDALARQQARVLAEAETRNGVWFDEEVEKLDRWAEDLKFGLERELKELDAEIRAARKGTKLAVTLAEKLEAQRLVKTLELRRNTKRRHLFDAQDEIDSRRTTLIEEIERRLRMTTTLDLLFTLRWTLV